MFEIKPNKRGSYSKKDYFSSLMDRIFNEDFSTIGLFGDSFKVDICEDAEKYLVTAELPGFNKEAINILYKNNYLTISAEREDVLKEKNGNYIRQERSCGEVKRQFHIENVDDNKIMAEFNNGVLNIILPKKEKELSENNTIKIK